MVQERVEVELVDGVADARLFLPDAGGPAPLVLFFMDAGGLRPAMTEMAERLVDAGYAVLQPNLYRRMPPFAPFAWDTVWSDPPERARIKALMDSFTPDQAMADARALLDHVAADRRVSAARVGVTGYCMGGRMALFAAAELSDRVIAAACVHAGGMVTPAPNSPHLGVPRIRARMYFGVSGEDASCSPEACGALTEALVRAGVVFQLEHEPEARHGYAVPDFPVFHPAAAARHWSRVLELFGETLHLAE